MSFLVFSLVFVCLVRFGWVWLGLGIYQVLSIYISCSYIFLSSFLFPQKKNKLQVCDPFAKKDVVLFCFLCVRRGDAMLCTFMLFRLLYRPGALFHRRYRIRPNQPRRRGHHPLTPSICSRLRDRWRMAASRAPCSPSLQLPCRMYAKVDVHDSRVCLVLI